MVVLQVKAKEEEFLTLHPLNGPREAIEGEEIEFSTRLTRVTGRSKVNELRVDVEAHYADDIDQDQGQLPPQVIYVAKQAEIVYRFRPDSQEATPEEHRQGLMKRELTVIHPLSRGESHNPQVTKVFFRSAAQLRACRPSCANLTGQHSGLDT